MEATGLGGLGVDFQGVPASGESSLNNGELSEDVVNSATSSGPRSITINGVKLSENINIMAETITEGADEMVDIIEDSFLRILRSTAKVGN